MPAAKSTSPKLEEHVHNFYPNQYNRSEEVCKNYYKGKSCMALRVSSAELGRRDEEWRAFYTACRDTDSYKDYVEMTEAFNANDTKRMKEVIKRVNTRCTVKKDEWGDNIFTHREDAYLPKPVFSDPSNPKSIYIYKEAI